jgi:hypothetical protein
MSSFFAAIQNWFSAGFHGRHLGLILQELGKLQPDALTSFVSAACGIPKAKLKRARFEAEVTFRGSKGWRRSDLAVFLEDEEEPTVLVEIKYFDKPLPETGTKPAQLDDYQAWKRNGPNRHVLILSREMYQVEGLILWRWDALARHLRPYVAKSDLIHMLVEYLQQEGIVMQNVDGYALMRYFKRLVCHNWKSGVLANNIEGPAEFTRLMKNLRLMSGTFEQQFKNAWREAGAKVDGKAALTKVASIDFLVRHTLKAATEASKLVDKDGELRSDMKNGGYVDVYAKHALGSGSMRYMRIVYGMYFAVSPNDTKEDPPLAYLYADAYGYEINRAGLNVYHGQKIKFAWVTDDAEISIERIEGHLRSLLQKTINKLADANLPLQPVQKKALIILKKSLRQGDLPELEAA